MYIVQHNHKESQHLKHTANHYFNSPDTITVESSLNFTQLILCRKNPVSAEVEHYRVLFLLVCKIITFHDIGRFYVYTKIMQYVMLHYLRGPFFGVVADLICFSQTPWFSAQLAGTHTDMTSVLSDGLSCSHVC